MLHDPLDQLQLHLPHLLPRPVRVGSLGVGLPADVRAWDNENSLQPLQSGHFKTPDIMTSPV